MCPDSNEYQLLDVGEGRKLERFGAFVLDRPAPAAEGIRRTARVDWRNADARFERAGGPANRWHQVRSMPAAWNLDLAPLRFELRLTDSGQVGVFPEQADNWQWLAARPGSEAPLRVLNLFAYTGGSTLAAARAGAEVVHLDAARGVVGWARRNAAASGLADAPIRWIVDDARRFVGRELRRGQVYQGLILDPPTYGHGPRGRDWQIDRDLPPFLRDCGKLLDRERAAFLLVTCHTPSWGPAQLREILQRAFPQIDQRLDCAPVHLNAATGVKLFSGIRARWPT